MRESRSRQGDPSRRGGRWILGRADLAVGGGRLTTLWHPLLPEFTAALPVEEGLLLLPQPTAPLPLRRIADARVTAAFLSRLSALASFLKFHGLGVAFEDVKLIGFRTGSEHRPALGKAPVPEWRAVPPALLVAAVAIRLGGGSVLSPDAEALRAEVERALEAGGLADDAAARAVEALQAHATGTSPEGLVRDLSRTAREGPELGPDLLGLSYPAVAVNGEGDVGARVCAAEGEAALFVVRGASRRSLAGFVEVASTDRLEEGGALKRLSRLLEDDPRAEGLSALAEGRRVGKWPPGPPIAVVALSGDVWDERSRKAVEADLDRAGLRLFETRTRPPHPWEPRIPLTARLSPGDVASLLWLPFRSWSEAAAAWDMVASAAREDPARFVRLAHGLAAGFDPAAERSPTVIRIRPGSAGREPLLSAAALLGSRFTEAELSWAAGVSEEEASGAVRRGRDAGFLVPEKDGWRFAGEEERRRRAGRLSSAARRSVVERLENAGLSGERLTVAALARGEPGDIHTAQALLAEAEQRGDRALAFELLARTAASAPDLGRSDLALPILWECGRVAEARAAAARLSQAGAFEGSLRARSALARVLARLGEAEMALAIAAADGSAAALLVRAQVFLDLKRTEEAALVLDGLPPPAGETPADEALRRARLAAEVASRRGDRTAARRLLEAATRALPASADPEEAREFLMTSGFVAIDDGRFVEARALFRRARDLSTDPRRRADASLDASTASFHAGEFAASEEELATALALYAEAGDEDRYLSALGNRIDLAFRAGRYDLAREALPPVLRFVSRPGREHLFLFAAASRQQLARLDGDDEAGAAAFREAVARRAAVPGHSTWREILILEAARLLTVRRPAEALPLLEKAGELPDNREQTEPLRRRILASARGDLGWEGGDGVGDLPAAERDLLQAEGDLRAGRAPRPEVLSRMESRLTDARGAASVVERLLEWTGRFPEFFARRGAEALLELGRRAAARAGLTSAGGRFAAALHGLTSVPSAREEPPATPPPFVAEDSETRKVLEGVRKVARTKLPVLILGETGTGKELLAREVHRLSGRTGRFVAVNVAALTGSLIESELFGHVRGAFTGADRDRSGLVEEASGGTLFLDEIGDLALPLQAKLLRVLQEGEVRRVGDVRTRPVDLRVVSATHRDLKAMVDDGSFRRDLLYRLGGLEVALPPLRRRPRDLARLVASALGTTTLTSEARNAVLAYAWPGNVRELLSGLEAARALAAPSVLVGLEHLPPALRRAAAGAPGTPAGTYREAVADAKRRAILHALEETRGNRTQAAKRLGLSRQSLLYEMKVLGLKP